jgi:hypothetical protein
MITSQPPTSLDFPLSGNVRIRQVALFLAMSESTVHRRVKDPVSRNQSAFHHAWWYLMPPKFVAGRNGQKQVNRRPGMSAIVVEKHHETRTKCKKLPEDKYTEAIIFAGDEAWNVAKR